ncbi:MAG: hypothetical protein R2777_03125 [Chitinophagales bacterium]
MIILLRSNTGDFTSPNLSPTQQGLWGGVIILGNAKISASASSVQMEGIPYFNGYLWWHK